MHYLYGDHLGSTSVTLNAAGQVVGQRRYEAYGQGRWSSGVEQTDFGFNSHREESEFGLYDYKARYFSPLLGRFISADSIVPDFSNPQDLNRYSYVRNNPLKYTDPSGHRCFTPAFGGGSCGAGGGGALAAKAATDIIALTLAANQFDLDIDLDLNLNRPSSSAPVVDTSVLIFVVGDFPETEAQRPALIAPEHIMHTPPMDLNPNLEDSNASSGGQGLTIEDTFFTAGSKGLPFKSGDLIHKEFATSQGNVDLLAEAIIEGSSLHLKDIAIYPNGSEQFDIGIKEVVRIRNQLAQEARSLGFEELRICRCSCRNRHSRHNGVPGRWHGRNRRKLSA